MNVTIFVNDCFLYKYERVRHRDNKTLGSFQVNGSAELYCSHRN